MIEINNLHFNYKTTNLFNNFSLQIKDSVTGLVGVNGAGKSTLVKLCVGLLKLEKGSIQINNYDIETEKVDVLKNIGILHENPKFPPWAKVRSYLVWVGRLRGLSKQTSISQSQFLINKMGLIRKETELISSLSAGLTQRFGLAQAIIGVPKIIFLDEPTANLDAKFRIFIFDWIKEIVQNFDCRFVILSHVLSDLERYCDSIAIIHDGKLISQFSIFELHNKVNLKCFNATSSNDQLTLLREYLLKNDIKIIEEKTNNVKFEISDNEQFTTLIRQDFSTSINYSPDVSKLEQLFFELIDKGEKNEL